MKPFSILLVEDEVDLREMFSAALRRASHHVATAASIRSATTIIQTLSFDLVVTDLSMPDGHGVEVIRAAQAANPGVHVIAISGDASPQNAEFQATAAATGVAFLAKPFTPAKLLSTISLVGLAVA